MTKQEKTLLKKARKDIREGRMSSHKRIMKILR